MNHYFENTTTLSSFIARDISSMMRRLTIRRFTTSEIALADTPGLLARERMDTPSFMSAILISNGVILISFVKNLVRWFRCYHQNNSLVNHKINMPQKFVRREQEAGAMPICNFQLTVQA
jgi:hypothetical protein